MSLDITLFIGTCDKYHMLWEYFMIQADKIINDNSSAFSNICKNISYS